MLLQVGVGVGEIDRTRVRVDVGKGVQDMGESFRGELVGLVVASVDGLEKSAPCSLTTRVGDAQAEGDSPS